MENEREVKQTFKQDLTKEKRPYLVIEESSKKFLILTLTKSKIKSEADAKDTEEEPEKPSFGRFGPLKCPCLKLDTYVILDTKIFLTRKFAEEWSFDLLTRNNNIEHDCLPPKQYLELREALDIY